MVRDASFSGAELVPAQLVEARLHLAGQLDVPALGVRGPLGVLPQERGLLLLLDTPALSVGLRGGALILVELGHRRLRAVPGLLRRGPLIRRRDGERGSRLLLVPVRRRGPAVREM